ncbi:ABC transporter ATP-binding protein, partial [Enterobacter bugandensis]|nr:ABC transporter ATP-binding protein [Enterobacter bugandensis]
QGTVLLVSHDRQFVDNSVTECWIFEGNGQISSFVGGYYDAHQQRAEAKPIRQVAAKVEETKVAAPVKSTTPAAKRPGKLSYNLQRELDQLPQQLEKLEHEIGKLQAEVSHADFFS